MHSHLPLPFPLARWDRPRGRVAPRAGSVLRHVGDDPAGAFCRAFASARLGSDRGRTMRVALCLLERMDGQRWDGIGPCLGCSAAPACAQLIRSGSGGVGLCSVWCRVVFQARLLRPSFDTNVTAWWLHDYRTFGTIAMDLVSPVPAQMWEGRAQSWRRCGRSSPAPAPTWEG